MLCIVTGLVLIAAVAIVCWLYVARRRHSPDAVINAVSRQIQLPDESPTIATVVNPEKLKDQPFFKDAQSGDKVLIYPHAKEVVLYRPNTNMVIGVAPISPQ